MPDIRALREQVLDINISVHGVWAQVDGLPARVIPLTPTAQDVPTAAEFHRSERRRTFAISRRDIPTIPRGTKIVIAEREGEEPLTWKVDSIEYDAPNHTRVIAVPA